MGLFIKQKGIKRLLLLVMIEMWQVNRFGNVSPFLVQAREYS